MEESDVGIFALLKLGKSLI